MTTHAQMAERSKELLDSLATLSVAELEQLVLYHNAAYFDRHAPEISDEAFDKLIETLRHQKPTSAVVDLIGGEQSDPGKGIKHHHPMLSLDKCYDDESFVKWREKIKGKLIAMPKIDGVACSIHYDKNGELILGATRGDGKTGENITENVKAIDDVKNKIGSLKAGLEVRGEVYMKLSRFQKHYATQFANPRNLAAGALKQKDVERSRAYGLSFFPYDVRGIHIETEQEKFALLEKLGFVPPPIRVVQEGEEGMDVYRDYALRREALDYEIDGVVFRADSILEQNRLGLTAHHPKWAIAYKFQGEGGQTELVRVQWSVGRTGTITPVAIVNPVFVSGATVTRASLHNLGRVRKLGLKEHALVEIVRRGGVIPHVERVLAAQGDEILAPQFCPSCQREAVQEDDFLRCSRPQECPDVLISRVIYFCQVMGIEGFGDRLVAMLVEKKLITQLPDLYRLSEPELLQLERMGPTLANKLIRERDGKRTVTLPTFLTALGFDEVGPTVSETIVQNLGSIEALFRAQKEDFLAIQGIGESIASALVRSLQHFGPEIEKLLTQINLLAAEKMNFDAGHHLFNKSVVFTGKMAHVDRKHAQKRVREVGGKTPGSVSHSTDYLVVGDDGSPLLSQNQKSTKHKEADKLKTQGSPIAIITETEFLQLLKSEA